MVALQMTLQPVFSIVPLFSTALWELLISRPVHAVISSSHLFLSLPCLLLLTMVPCKMAWASPDEWEMWPYHCSLHLFMIIMPSLCGTIDLAT